MQLQPLQNFLHHGPLGGQEMVERFGHVVATDALD